MTSHRFEPYVDNGGTCIAIAGEDYCIVATDTRMSLGYSIVSRNMPKTFQVTSKCILASCGMQADRNYLQKLLWHLIRNYEFEHGHEITTPALAQLLSNRLYYRRFFPLYTFNLLGGLDEEGRGCVYGYDAVGNTERLTYGCQGSGESLAQVTLDSQIGRKHVLQDGKTLGLRNVPLDEAIDLIKDVFTSAGERDIYTGDAVKLHIVTKDGVRDEMFPLKRD